MHDFPTYINGALVAMQPALLTFFFLSEKGADNARAALELRFGRL